MASRDSSKQNKNGEKSFVKGTCLSDFGADGIPAVVDVKGGKILRIRPLHYDWKYKKEQFKPWKIEARGTVFEPYLKTLPPPFALAYKKRVYSPNRILYPLKRVDWDPKGNRNTENRGQSSYVRISWDEAVDIIVKELVQRISKKKKRFYGCSGYPECKFATFMQPVPKPCPQCNNLMTAQRNKTAKCVKCGYTEKITEEEKQVSAT